MYERNLDKRLNGYEGSQPTFLITNLSRWTTNLRLIWSNITKRQGKQTVLKSMAKINKRTYLVDITNIYEEDHSVRGLEDVR